MGGQPIRQARAILFPPEADLVDHILVDGATRPRSVLTLSHWPGSPTSRSLWRDTSTQISLAWLGMAAGEPFLKLPPRRRESYKGRILIERVQWGRLLERLRRGEVAVALDHLDVDGVLAAMLLLRPELQAHASVLAAASVVGDFRRVAGVSSVQSVPLANRLAPSDQDLVAARVAWGLASVLTGPCPSWIGTGEPLDVPPGSLGALLAGDALASLIGELLEGARPELWEPWQTRYLASVQSRNEGEVRIEEHPEAHLAVVELDRGVWPEGVGWHGPMGQHGEAVGATRPASPSVTDSGFDPAAIHDVTDSGFDPAAVHDVTDSGFDPAAVHDVTDAPFIIVVAGDEVEMRMRYESWVRYVSRDVASRPELFDLAASLDALETPGTGCTWHWEGRAAPAPVLRRMWGSQDQAGSPAPVWQVVEIMMERLSKSR